MRSLHEVHEENALWAGLVCPHDSTQGSVNSLG
jgi:hypothetical protein